MRSILFLIVSVTLVMAGCKAQDPAVKQAQAAEDSLKYEVAVAALTNHDFVLEADRITFKYGQNAYVTPNTNFVLMKGEKATIQFAFNSPYAGPNGIGGITVDGSASNIKMKTDKKGNVYYSMSVFGTAVSAIVTINLIAGTNQCTAVVTPNMSGRVITFTGYLYPTSESSVFKGRTF